MWHITYLCNHKCKFCFAPKNINYSLNEPKIEDYIIRFKSMGVKKIDISGGEPLHYMGLDYMCKQLKNNNIYMTITTRGDSLDNNKWLINSTDLFSRIIVSLDVPNTNLFEQLSGPAILFNKTLTLIKELIDNNYKFVRINTVITSFLVDDNNLMEMVNLVNSIGFCEWCLIEPHPANKKKSFNEVFVSKRQFEIIVEKIKGYMSNNNKCKIIIRYSANYSGYWVLYPNGIIAKHTINEKDDFEVDLLSTQMDHILQRINENFLWIPEEK